MKASLENNGAAAGATNLALGSEQTVYAQHHHDQLCLTRLPVKILPVLLSPAHENEDGQGLLEFQSHHYYPRAAISENPFWVWGSAFTILQLRRLTQREERDAPKSHS